jgi:hypothetical protein
MVLQASGTGTHLWHEFNAKCGGQLAMPEAGSDDRYSAGAFDDAHLLRVYQNSQNKSSLSTLHDLVPRNKVLFAARIGAFRARVILDQTLQSRRTV